MCWNIMYNDITGVVELVYTDGCSSGNLFDEIAAAHSLAVEKGTLKFMIDSSFWREQQQQPKVFQQNSRLPDTIPLSRESQIAFVYPEQHKSYPRMRFFETFCSNRGYLIGSFKSREEAEIWLQLDRL